MQPKVSGRGSWPPSCLRASSPEGLYVSPALQVLGASPRGMLLLLILRPRAKARQLGLLKAGDGEHGLHLLQLRCGLAEVCSCKRDGG